MKKIISLLLSLFAVIPFVAADVIAGPAIYIIPLVALTVVVGCIVGVVFLIRWIIRKIKHKK